MDEIFKVIGERSRTLSQADLSALMTNLIQPDGTLQQVSDLSTAISTTYQILTEKDQPSGYAGLDGSGLLDDAEIPAGITRDSELATALTAYIPKALLTTKGDVIAASGSATPVRVPVGANGTVLTANSGVAAGVEFAAGSSRGANPMTTAGDLIVGGSAGAETRLAKGADGQVLTVDPTTHLLVWATPTTGSAPTVQEVDGSPSIATITTLEFPNGTVTNPSAGVARYTPAAAPASAKNLLLHLDAGAGVTKDGSDLVSDWADQGDFGHHAVQATATNQPLWVTSVINGQPVIRFDGVDNYLVWHRSSVMVYRYTLAIVIRPRDATALEGILAWQATLANTAPTLLIRRDTTNVTVFVNGAVRWTIAHATDATKLYVLTYESGVYNLYVDGTAQTAFAGVLSAQSLTDALYLGNGHNGYAFVEIPELYLYDYALSSGDRGTLTTALQTKYGI